MSEGRARVTRKYGAAPLLLSLSLFNHFRYFSSFSNPFGYALPTISLCLTRLAEFQWLVVTGSHYTGRFTDDDRNAPLRAKTNFANKTPQLYIVTRQFVSLYPDRCYSGLVLLPTQVWEKGKKTRRAEYRMFDSCANAKSNLFRRWLLLFNVSQ